MKLEFHEIADLFPLMKGKPFEELCDSLRTNGFLSQHPIILFEGKILDGRNRHRACLKTGVEPVTETPEIKDPFAFVAAANLSRRNLSEEERAFIGSAMANLKRGGYRHGEKVKPSENGLTSISVAEAAKLLGVSESMVERIRTVESRGIPELAQAVKDGEIKVNPAYKISRLPKDEQPAAISAAKSKQTKSVRGTKKKGRPASKGSSEGKLSRSERQWNRRNSTPFALENRCDQIWHGFIASYCRYFQSPEDRIGWAAYMVKASTKMGQVFADNPEITSEDLYSQTK